MKMEGKKQQGRGGLELRRSGNCARVSCDPFDLSSHLQPCLRTSGE